MKKKQSSRHGLRRATLLYTRRAIKILRYRTSRQTPISRCDGTGYCRYIRFSFPCESSLCNILCRSVEYADGRFALYTNTFLCLCDYILTYRERKMNNTLCKNRYPNLTISAKISAVPFGTALDELLFNPASLSERLYGNDDASHNHGDYRFGEHKRRVINE